MCLWFTDNQNVARIIDFGSPKLPLQEEARRIFSYLRSSRYFNRTRMGD